jgi:hypothetical protein
MFVYGVFSLDHTSLEEVMMTKSAKSIGIDQIPTTIEFSHDSTLYHQNSTTKQLVKGQKIDPNTIKTKKQSVTPQSKPLTSNKPQIKATIDLGKKPATTATVGQTQKAKPTPFGL